MQDPKQASTLRWQVIEPLKRSLEERREVESRKAAASKVEFFTVVRGE
jgi:alpha-D-ribose 1-methylphosphonate 5-triphosphate synthase subunit PhnG